MILCYVWFACDQQHCIANYKISLDFSIYNTKSFESFQLKKLFILIKKQSYQLYVFDERRR